MQNILKLIVLCLLAVSAAARAQDGPKLIGEKTILKLDDSIEHEQNRGMWCMRLSPDGRRVLYLCREMYKTTAPGGAERRRRGYKLVLRDRKTGKDTPVPVAAMFDDDFALAYLSMTVFDPAGRTLVVPAGEDGNQNGLMEPMPPMNEKCKVGLYDIASGKLKTLDPKADLIFPTFSPNGKTLLVLAIEMVGKKAKVHVTPTDKIKFRALSKTGLIRSVCPTADVMAMVLLSGEEKPQPGKFVLYDLKADTVRAELASPQQSRKMEDYNPQWTADGRYLYYVTVKRETRAERRHYEYLTRIWDAKAGKEVGILSGMAPIGAGPGTRTMVLTKLPGMQQQPQTPPEIVLHAQGHKTLGQEPHRLGDASTRPISTQGKWLVFIRKGADGTEAACLAEIALPKK